MYIMYSMHNLLRGSDVVVCVWGVCGVCGVKIGCRYVCSDVGLY
jgi:hypothetical protein